MIVDNSNDPGESSLMVKVENILPGTNFDWKIKSKIVYWKRFKSLELYSKIISLISCSSSSCDVCLGSCWVDVRR